jgi:hypothetical protein
VPPLGEHSPDVLLLILSDSVDVLTYVSWKLSRFTAGRVMRSGTNLDSSRLRFLLAEHLDVNAQRPRRPGRIYYSSAQRHYRGFARRHRKFARRLRGFTLCRN